MYSCTKFVLLLFFLVALTPSGANGQVDPSADSSCRRGMKSIMNATLANLIEAGALFEISATAYKAIGLTSAAAVAQNAKDVAVDIAAVYEFAATNYEAAIDDENANAAAEALQEANNVALTFDDTLLAGGDVAMKYNIARENGAIATYDAAAAASDASNVAAAAYADAVTAQTYAVVALKDSVVTNARKVVKGALTMYDAAVFYQTLTSVVVNTAPTDNNRPDVMQAYQATRNTYKAAGRLATYAGKDFSDMAGSGSSGSEASFAGQRAAKFAADIRTLEEFQEIVQRCQL